MKIRFDYILFDVVGTTVKDSTNGESFIMDCFLKSFNIHGYKVGYDKINHQRGKGKRDAIKQILADCDYDISLTEKIYSDFIGLLNESIGQFIEMDMASELFGYLREKSIKIGLGSGLPKEFLRNIIKQVGWSFESFDYVGSSEELGKGRPNPIMIFDSMNKLNIHDVSRVLKIGDTVVDIQEGKNAGVRTASVLTGTQSKDELEKFSPDYIFLNINELYRIL